MTKSIPVAPENTQATEAVKQDYSHQSKPSSHNEWFLYIIENKLGQYYTGVTTSPERRISQHRGLLAGGAKALKGKQPIVFKAVFRAKSKQHAHQLEYQIKQLTRKQKEQIIHLQHLENTQCVTSLFVDEIEVN